MLSCARARLTAVGVVAVAALALPLVTVPPTVAQAASPSTPSVGGAGWAAQEESAQYRALLAAVEEAAAIRAAGDGSTSSRSAAPRPPTDPDEQALDAATRQLVESGGAVAVAARVETPTLQWSDAEGVRRYGHRAKAKEHDRFRVASITKPMIATLVMQEVERGTLALDTRVEDVLPGLLPGHPEVTVEHLLSHRSGMPTGTVPLLTPHITDPSSVDDLIDAMGHDYTDADQVAAGLATPWEADPGTQHVYSNSGYVVLGMLLEEVTGKDLAHLLRHRVFRAAGMRHSDYPREPQAHGPFLVDAASFGEPDLPWRSLDGLDPDVFGAAGAVTSTTADLVAFSDALLGGRLVEPTTVADMMTPRSEAEQYGLGVLRIPDPCASPDAPAWLYGHNGASFGAWSFLLSSPDGTRSLSLGTTGRDWTEVPGVDVSPYITELLVPMLLATCGPVS